MQEMTPKNTEEDILVAVLDFDLTVAGINRARHHIHNIIQEAINKHNAPFQKEYEKESDPAKKVAISKEANETNPYLNLEKQWELVKTVPVRGPKNRWRDIILQLIQRGIYVVFASFNDFELIMKKYLIEVVGLPKEIVDEKIIFIAKNPPPPIKTDNPETYYGLVKVSYINQAVEKISEKTGSLIANWQVGFVDDSSPNYRAAKAAGYQAIYAALENDNFFYEVDELYKLTPIKYSEEDEEAYTSEEDNDSNLSSSTDTYNSDYSCSGSQELVVKVPNTGEEQTYLGGSGESITLEELDKKFKQLELKKNSDHGAGEKETSLDGSAKATETKKPCSPAIMALYNLPSSAQLFQPTPSSHNTSNIHETMTFKARERYSIVKEDAKDADVIESKPTAKK